MRLLTIMIFTVVYFASCNNDKRTIKHVTVAKVLDSVRPRVVSNRKLLEENNHSDCVNYSESSFDPGKHDSFLEYSKADKKYLKGKKLLSNDFVTKFLFSNSDSTFAQNVWTRDTIDRLNLNEYLNYSKFYFVDTILNTEIFTGVIIEQIEDQCSQKFLWTLNKANTVISKVQVACYCRAGTYLNAKGEQQPYWSERTGCISKNSIVTEDYIYPTNDYDIDINGRITLKLN